MKKLNLIFLLLGMIFIVGCQSRQDEAMETSGEVQMSGNYSDEMKIPYGKDLSDWGPDSVERQGDHQNSPYFYNLDFYNMESSDTLTILPKFKTVQQTSEWSCGVTCVLMIMNYYDMLGDYDEESLALFRSNGLNEEATTLRQTMEIFEGVGGFNLTTTFDLIEDDIPVEEQFTFETIQNYLEQEIPIMVCWNEWGGHWQVIIGYDTMGTESILDDVIIVADPYDTSDHNQDGYCVYNALRFIYNFSTYNLFPEEELNDRIFIAAEPVAVN